MPIIERRGICLKINPAKYDYVMYVDASGDDGFKFEQNSSVCYAVAALLVKQDDIAHNLSILNQIKHLIGCKPTDEVKYSRIRRHRRGVEALALLKGLKGEMSCFIIFKKELPSGEIANKSLKTLSVSCHAMAVASLDAHPFSEGEKVLIVIDRMKNTEEQPLEWVMESGSLSDRLHPERNFSTKTIFRDSKDSNFLLIQIADLLCGTVREHFEQYETNEDMIYFHNRCPNCKRLSMMKRGTHRICKHGKTRSLRILNSKNLSNIYHLIPNKDSTKMIDYLFMRPSKMMDQHFYILCDKK